MAAQALAGMPVSLSMPVSHSQVYKYSKCRWKMKDMTARRKRQRCHYSIPNDAVILKDEPWHIQRLQQNAILCNLSVDAAVFSVLRSDFVAASTRTPTSSGDFV